MKMRIRPVPKELLKHKDMERPVTNETWSPTKCALAFIEYADSLEQQKIETNKNVEKVVEGQKETIGLLRQQLEKAKNKYCRCSEEETTGSTTFECCNICGKILNSKTKVMMKYYNLRNRIQQFELHMNSMPESDRIKWIEIKNDAYKLEQQLEKEREDKEILNKNYKIVANQYRSEKRQRKHAMKLLWEKNDIIDNLTSKAK